jgi:hypothetical protein
MAGLKSAVVIKQALKKMAAADGCRILKDRY